MPALEMSIVEDLVTTDLIADKYATKNQTHISTLRELFVSHGIPVPNLNNLIVEMRPKCMELATSIGLLHEPSYAFLKSNTSELPTKDGVRVFLTAADHPGRFYVQLEEFNKQLDNINEEIQLYLSRMENEKRRELERFEKARKELREIDLNQDVDSDDESWEYETSEAYKSFVKRTQLLHTELTFDKLAWFNSQKIPLYCLAKQPKENVYNRAQILSAVLEDKSRLRVFYVDYGDYDTVSFTDLLPIEDRLIKLLPFQAIECSLNGLKPLVNVNLEFRKFFGFFF